MHALEIVTVVGIVLVAGHVLAPRLGAPAPLVLLVLGAAVGFVPVLGDVELPPEVVLFVFLPALLHWEAVTISIREMRANLRSIVLQSTVLVLATAGAVAAVGHLLGLPWPMAFVLGAVLAPTDATAVSTVAGRLPRRARTVLRAESLLNDGTALVIYAVAVGVAVGELDVGPAGVSWRLAGSYAGGVAVGVVVAGTVIGVRRHLHDGRLDTTVGILTPFVTYLPAEVLHVSGVVAVVTCGLLLSQVGSRLGSAGSRMQSTGFWTSSTFVLNAALFVLIGLELRAVVEGHPAPTVWSAVVATGAVAATVIATRLVWTTATIYAIRAVDRRPAQRLRRTGVRARLPTQWAGFRGAVSLAAALAVPATDASGAPLAGRDTIVLVTFGVIVTILVTQGLTLPAVIRFSRAGQDPAEEVEHRRARIAATSAAASALARRAAQLDVPEAVQARVHRTYQDVLHQLRGDDPVPADHERALLLALLEDERRAVTRLRDDRSIDDGVVRRVHTALDAEEVRLRGIPVDE